MNLTLLVVIVAVVAIGLVAALAIAIAKKTAPNGSGKADPSVYVARTAVFTPAERSFLGVMDGVLPDGVSWLGKVRLGDVFVTRKGLSPSQRSSAWNRINQKHVDFLLVRVSDFAPLAGIELDDSSHDADDRKARDAFVDEVFRSANLPLLHVPAQSAYNPAELRKQIATLIGDRAAPTSA